jgi:V8-like Glu-specific endopeptidase
MSSRAQNSFPIGSEDIRRQPSEAATEDIPEQLEQLSQSSTPPKRSTRFIERSKDASPVRQTDSYRPAWIAKSFVPKRMRLPEPPRVLHRGHHMTPLAPDCHFYGSDNRAIYNDTSYPWGCVCRISNANGRMGSGALIGPRHVLTASHVVAWDTDVAEKIELHFAGNTASATVFDTSAHCYTPISDVGYSTVDEDYALLVINERLGDRWGWLGAKTYDSGWDDLAVWNSMG